MLDSSHLDRQVLGDRQLRKELLQLFAARLEELAPILCPSAGLGRRQAAHALKGASLAVGAFALANLCDGIEGGGGPQAGELERVMEATRIGVAELLRGCGQ